MDEYLCEHMLDVILGYDVNGYRVDDKSIRYSHELVLSIGTPEVTEFESGPAIEAQLKEDGNVLTVLRHIILKATGIKEEGS